MKVLVCGGRDFQNEDLLFHTLDQRHAESAITLIIEGGQRTYQKGRLVGGADFLAYRWATSRGIPFTTVPADWTDLSHPNARIRHGAGGRLYDASAGHRRNSKMLGMNPDLVVAFAGGTGTADMVRQARGAGVETIEVPA